MSAYVSETDQQAREECEEGVWYFLKNCLKGHLRREGRQLTFGPGVPYIPAAAWKEYLKGYKPGRKLLGDVENWDELDASQSIIVGSAETVYRRIWRIIEQAKVGNLLIQFHIGNMPDEITRKSMKLFAEEVAPRLREDSLRYFQQQFAGVNIEPAAAEAVH
jgi:alkanesulfonate monooxygenase SsuD/methylene tetrahydromethanopterin reductase-like flavin-dependent oxidoreductase (luciferase family)